jgi:hypothetical protein
MLEGEESVASSRESRRLFWSMNIFSGEGSKVDGNGILGLQIRTGLIFVCLESGCCSEMALGLQDIAGLSLTRHYLLK